MIQASHSAKDNNFNPLVKSSLPFLPKFADSSRALSENPSLSIKIHKEPLPDGWPGSGVDPDMTSRKLLTAHLDFLKILALFRVLQKSTKLGIRIPFQSSSNG
jgi:hypothetical protein